MERIEAGSFAHTCGATTSGCAGWLEAWHSSIPGGSTEETAEIGLILEDDLELSPFAWRWLKAAHAAYGLDDRVAGFTLNRLELCAARCPDLAGGPDYSGGAFYYPILGTRGYSPRAKSFAKFRRWYYRQPIDFKPYVDGISPTDWYRALEENGKHERMWSMHYIYYTHRDKYTVYTKCKNNRTLALNHLEVGLNYEFKGDPKYFAMAEWDPELVRFPKDPLVLNYSGEIISGLGLPGGAITPSAL